MKITETKKFALTPTVKDAVRVSFINRKGGVDVATFTRFYDSEVKTKPQTYYAGVMQKTYSVDAERTDTYHSQHLTEQEFRWLQDLMVSPNVTINYRPVRVMDTSYKYNSIDRLWTIELQVQSIYPENKITR